MKIAVITITLAVNLTEVITLTLSLTSAVPNPRALDRYRSMRVEAQV